MSFKILELEEIEAKEYEHYGGNMIPKGCLSILAGQGKAGKSTFMCYLAERLYTEGKTVIVSNEEDAGIIKSRFRPHSKVSIVSFSSNPDASKIKKEDLLEIIDSYDIILVDSMITFNEGKDLNKSGTAEAFLAPFISKVVGTNKSIVFLCHTNKGNGNSLKDMISGSERITSGARHCKVLLLDERNGKRFVADVKDNTGLPEGIKYEIVSERKGEKTVIVKELIPTDEDLDKIVYLNSRDAKIKKWNKELFSKDAKEKKEKLPLSIQRVLKSCGGEEIDPSYVVNELGENERIYFSEQIKKTGNKWVTKTKKGRQVTYHWTEEALEWLREQEDDYPF